MVVEAEDHGMSQLEQANKLHVPKQEQEVAVIQTMVYWLDAQEAVGVEDP